VKPKFVAAITFLLAVAFVTAGGSQQPPDDGQKYSPSLVVAPFSNNPKYLKFPDGRQQLTYTNENQYPAEDVVSFFKKELRKRGWKLLPYIFFSPDKPSSYKSGWGFIEDHTQKHSKALWQWSADWEDQRHDLTEYFLQYESPTNSPLDAKTLQVAALYIPAEVAAKMKHIADDLQRQVQPK
jgi:hypothetical protein